MENKKSGKLVYVLLFVFGFVFFLYLTFPYGILKEAVIAEVSKNTGFNIRIKQFGPDLPLGFEAEDIVVSKGNHEMSFKSAEVSISILSLFVANATADIELTSRNNGTLEASASWGILQLFDQNFLPSSVSVEADRFDIGPMANFGLKTYAKTANDLIKGTLSKMLIAGNLGGTIDADLDVGDPLQSEGVVDLKLSKASLDMNDPNLNLSKQIFKKAAIQADLKGGKLNVSKASGFHSQELVVDVNGSAQLKNPMKNSLLNIGMDIKLTGSLQENFDFVLGMMGGSNGVAKYRLSGTFGKPNFKSQ